MQSNETWANVHNYSELEKLKVLGRDARLSGALHENHCCLETIKEGKESTAPPTKAVCMAAFSSGKKSAAQCVS